MSKTERKTIQVLGKNVSYLETAKKHELPSLLFLHGWALTGDAFKHTIDNLSEHYHVVAPDMPGFGTSEALDGYKQYLPYADFFAAFLKKLKLDSVNLVGQSMGGGVSFALAAHYPRLVNRIVVANSSAVPMPSIFKILFWRTPELIQQAFNSRMRAENFHLMRSFAINFSKRMPDILHTLHVPTKVDLRPILSQVQAPTLIIWGKNDIMIPEYAIEEMEKHLPNSTRLTVENGYHEWSLIYPEEFSRHVHGHLEA